MPVPLRRRRVLQHVRGIKPVAQQFDINGRIVAVALNFIEFQPRGAERIVHDIDIGTLLRIERCRIESRDPRFDVGLQATRGGYPRRTVVIQQIIEVGAVVNVVADAGRIRRRQRQSAEYEVIDQLLERAVARRLRRRRRGRGRGRRPNAGTSHGTGQQTSKLQVVNFVSNT